jgi:hypothetical protein
MRTDVNRCANDCPIHRLSTLYTNYVATAGAYAVAVTARSHGSRVVIGFEAKFSLPAPVLRGESNLCSLQPYPKDHGNMGTWGRLPGCHECHGS